MEDKRLVSDADIRELLIEAIKKAKIEALNLAIRIHESSYSRGGFRVAIHNKIVELEGSGEKA